jgi:ssDNA-binding Zn-finger/Zn-ribbon topoisomerase 1
MTSLQANCPACGAEVLFKQGSSVVVVCQFCNSVVARTDRGLEDLGRVAEVVESGSPLETGLRGVYRGTAFELTGRAQLGHSMGGMWDEWYAAFADGRWGWLAEAQGRFYMSFQAPPSVQPPPFESLTPGMPVPQIPTPMPLTVAERGEARYLAAEGEIPFLLTPGESYPYADLSGAGGAFATIDYGEERPLVFVGREVTLTDIGIVPTGRTREREAKRVSSAQLQCPQCGGPLELRAPDVAERVTCPNCGSLLDINRGQLKYLKTLQPVGYKPDLPLGAEAEFEGQKLTIIGFMTRSVEFEGVRYFWQEYLLYNPAVGFRWLVQSDGHWNFVRPVPPGEVVETDKRAAYGGKSYKKFQDAPARVDYVTGEFYWKVEAGEQVRAVDYVRAPEMLSKEATRDEVNWSLGRYVPVKEIKEKFGVKELPRPATVAPNQPFPHKGVYKLWPLLLLVMLGTGLLTSLLDARRKVFEQTFTLQSAAAPATQPAPAATPNVIQLPGGRTVTIPVAPTPAVSAAAAAARAEGQQILFTDAFELQPRQNIRVTAEANVDNSYLYVGGDLIDEQTGLVQQFDIPIEYYAGVEEGESWTEGKREQAEYLSALPGGRYVMRLEAQWEDWKTPTTPRLTVRVEQGVTRGLNFLLALLAVSLIPVLVIVLHINFERRRWADSAFSPYQTGDGGGDDE